MAHLLTQIRGSPVYHKPNMYLYLSITISIKIYTVFIPFCMCSSCDKGGLQLEFVSISRVINHMTCYNSSDLIGGKCIKKNPLQDLLSSLNALISTNEST